MTTYYIKKGNTFSITDAKNLDIHEKLPPTVFVLKFNPNTGFYLEEVDSFDVSGKIYGDVYKRVDRVMNTFHSRDNATGLMLNGEKGSGKTMLAKLLSVQFSKEGNPTILINQPYCGDGFNSFMQSIDQPCMVLFDEFEKIYSREEQENVLTLFDGVYPSKKLFVVTCNDIFRMNEHMQNRPGRFFYSMKYNGMDEAFIREYTMDKLNNLSHLTDVIKFSGMFSKFNFDMLKALIEEMNRYDEGVKSAATYLNAIPDNPSDERYTFVMIMAGDMLPLKESDIHPNYHEVSENPTVEGFSVYLRNPLFVPSKKDDDEDGVSTSKLEGTSEVDANCSTSSIGLFNFAKNSKASSKTAWMSLYFDPADVKEIVYDGGMVVTMMDEYGNKVQLKKKPKPKGYNYLDYL